MKKVIYILNSMYLLEGYFQLFSFVTEWDYVMWEIS